MISLKGKRTNNFNESKKVLVLYCTVVFRSYLAYMKRRTNDNMRVPCFSRNWITFFLTMKIFVPLFRYIHQHFSSTFVMKKKHLKRLLQMLYMFTPYFFAGNRTLI